MIRGFYEVNNKTGQGIEKLKSAIAQEAAQLPQMGSLMNPAWIAARDELCGLSETNISKQKLVEAATGTAWTYPPRRRSPI